MPEIGSTTNRGPAGEAGASARLARPRFELERLARDLAATRREAAALRRENDRLRARLGSRFRRDAGAVMAEREEPRAAEMWCSRCGVTVSPPAAEHEHVLVLAACCPHCDGPLVSVGPDAAAVAPELDPSTYLG